MRKYHIKNIDDPAYSRDYETLERSLQFRIGFALKYRYVLPVLKKIQRDKAIIDIGCAHGVFLNYLLKNGFCRLFGMDLKNQLILATLSHHLKLLSLNRTFYIRAFGKKDRLMLYTYLECFIIFRLRNSALQYPKYI